MRQVLFRISFGKPWAFWVHDSPDGWPEIGFIWLWLIVVGAMSAWELWRRRNTLNRALVLKTLGWWLAGIPLGMAFSMIGPTLLPATQDFEGNPVSAAGSRPLYGYGFMVMLGFLSGILLAQWRAPKLGYEREMVWDAGIWLLLGGVFGGRLFYLIQYRHEVYGRAHSLKDAFVATINLTSGGLVLIGGLIGGGLGFYLFCRRRKLDPLNVADLFTPSVFLGIGFGRIGCLLNGCCFGDRCTLPWGIRFPNGSVTFKTLAERGFVDAAAAATMPLHPTQIYSSIDGFLLAIVTSILFRERRWRGEVFAWGCVMYSITRFLMEFIRGDEMGQFGTGLTISQLYSLGIATLGGAILVWHAIRPNSAAVTRTST